MIKTNNHKSSAYYGMLIILITTMLFGCASSSEQSFTTVTGSDASRMKENPRELARIRTAIAAQFIRENQLDDAKRQLERVLEADPGYAPAYDMLGVLYQQEGSPENLRKAETFFKKAIFIDSKFVQVRNNYGVYLSQMNRHAEALKQFEIAASTLGYEGRANALENLGRTALKLNRPQYATQTFFKAMEANRQSVVARIELIDIFLSQGKNKEAESLYNDLVVIIGYDNLGSREIFQGIRLAKLANNAIEQQRLSRQLLDRYPTSDEARKLKVLLTNPGAAWK